MEETENKGLPVMESLHSEHILEGPETYTQHSPRNICAELP